MQTHGLKILLVDDTQIVLQHLQLLLSSLEQVSSINAVMDGETGLALAEQYQPDIVVLDINMPRMNGIEVLKRLSARRVSRPVIIMLTNNTFAGYRDECLRLGADYFLDKSKDFELMTSIVQRISEEQLIINN